VPPAAGCDAVFASVHAHTANKQLVTTIRVVLSMDLGLFRAPGANTYDTHLAHAFTMAPVIVAIESGFRAVWRANAGRTMYA
jgi:hypothetical protein